VTAEEHAPPGGRSLTVQWPANPCPSTRFRAVLGIGSTSETTTIRKFFVLCWSMYCSLS